MDNNDYRNWHKKPLQEGVRNVERPVKYNRSYKRIMQSIRTAGRKYITDRNDLRAARQELIAALRESKVIIDNGTVNTASYIEHSEKISEVTNCHTREELNHLLFKWDL